MRADTYHVPALIASLINAFVNLYAKIKGIKTLIIWRFKRKCVILPQIRLY